MNISLLRYSFVSISVGLGSYLIGSPTAQSIPVQQENDTVERSHFIYDDLDAGESLHGVSMSSASLEALEPASAGDSLITLRDTFRDTDHSSHSSYASTDVFQNEPQPLLATTNESVLQASRLLTAQWWTDDLIEVPIEVPIEGNDEYSWVRGDRPLLMTQETPALDSAPDPDLDIAPLEDDTEDRVEEDTDDGVSDSDEDERLWTFQFSPYAFIPVSVQGDSTVEGITADVDLGLDDILDFFVFAASGRFEAWRNNRFGIIVDGLYAQLGTDGEGVLEGPRGFITFDVEADVDYDQAIFDFGLGYRTEIDDGNDTDRATLDGVPDGLFDIIAGVRVQHLNQTIDLDVEATGANRRFAFDRDLGRDKTWVEPLLSARLRYNLSRKLGFISRGDISGFGIDGMSLTWRLLGGVDWIFTGDTSLSAGYSVFGIDYETGEGRDEFGIDQVQHGPFVAFTVRF